MTKSLEASASTMRWNRVRIIFATACVAVFSACGGGGGSGGASDTPATPPSITGQPASQSVATGSSATFSVTATGTGLLSYQWASSRDGTTYLPLSGATTASYSITAASVAQSGTYYRVAVSNAAGTTTSSAAMLTVLPAPGLSLLAGNIGGRGNFDGTGSAARLNIPYAVAVDSIGNVYVAEFTNSVIRKVTPAGEVTVFAGASLSKGSNDGVGTAARFNGPTGVSIDAAGNLYVADTGNNTIRKITPAGVVTTLAGLAGVGGSTDGVGSAARFNRPSSLVVDITGTVYVAGNNTVRKITPAGVVSTLAGTAGSSGVLDGSGAAARFAGPIEITVDSSGLLYVTDGQTIRTVSVGGFVTTLAIAGATFGAPDGIALDANGNLYVTDSSADVIWKITAGSASILAGVPGVAGVADGTGSTARFRVPRGLAIDAQSNLYVADSQNDTIRKVTAAGAVSTLAGLASDTGSADGVGGAAQFDLPEGVAADVAGNAYVADYNNNTIRKITPAGLVTTIAGSPGVAGSADGPASQARFFKPMAVAVSSAGDVFVADAGNNTIRKISVAGIVTTLAGSAGTVGASDGLGATATFNFPAALAIDSSGYLYIADSQNNLVRKVSPAGLVSTLAGSGIPGSADGQGASAKFFNPEGIAVDMAGTVYVADTFNYTIRKITSTGGVTTLAGTALVRGSSDVAGSTTFYYPQGLSVDGAGDLFIADSGNYTIRKVSGAGVVSTVVGVAGQGGVRLGADGRLYGPTGVAAVSSNRILIATSAAIVVANLP